MRKLTLQKMAGAVLVTLGAWCGWGADTPPTDVALVDLTGSGKGTAWSNNTSGWYGGSTAATAFNDTFNNNNRSMCQQTTVDWCWTFNEPTVVNAYKIYAWGYYNNNGLPRMPKTWRFEAKNAEDEEWTTLDERTDSTSWSSGENRYYKFANSTAYDSYRIISTATFGNDGYTNVFQLEFFDVNCVRLESAPTAARSANGFTVSAKIKEGGGNAYVIYGTEYPYAHTNLLASSVVSGTTYQLELTDLEDATCYGFGVIGVGENGNAIEYSADNRFLNNPEAGYTWTFEVSAGEGFKTFLGSETLTNFPLLVRIDASAITGFSYGDLKSDASDLVFVDDNYAVYESEIDTWDSTGVSFVWVKVPALAAASKFTCYYGGPSVTRDPSALWTDYLAVIHGGAAISNSAPSGLAVSAQGTTAVATGHRIGGGINKAAVNSIGVTLANPIKAGKTTATSPLTFSAWYRRAASGGTALMFSTEYQWNNSGILALCEGGSYFSVAANQGHQGTSGKGALVAGT